MDAEFSAIILAGGRSLRMGQPKAELKFQGSTLLDRTIAQLRRRFDEIVVVSAPAGIGLPGNVELVRDEREYEGPLPALARGLRKISNDAAFACSCDLPLLNADVALSLCAMLDRYDAVIPEVGGLAQPLHAVYRKRSAAAIDALIAAGEQRLTSIVNSISARRLREQELRQIDPDLNSFLNVNTPEDYERALRLISR